MEFFINSAYILLSADRRRDLKKKRSLSISYLIKSICQISDIPGAGQFGHSKNLKKV